MVRLDPCMVRTMSFGDIEVQFLDRNELYFTRMEGAGRSRKEHYRVGLGRSLKTAVPVRREDFPRVPVKGKPTVDKELMLFASIMMVCAVEGKYPSTNEMSVYQAVKYVSSERFTCDNAIRQVAQSTYERYLNEQQTVINKEWVPMIVLSQEDSSLIANIFTYKGDSKKFTQGLQALGIDVKISQNYLTEGISINDLEGEILNLRDRESSRH